MYTLDMVTVGDYAFVESLLSYGLLRDRMLALGLTKGTIIEVVRKGPAGDPTVYLIRGAMIALRKEESALIEVRLWRSQQ